MEKGGLELVSGAIVNFPLEAGVCRTALSLFRNISANDALKTRLLNEGGLRLVLGCMSEHKNDKALQVHSNFADYGCCPLVLFLCWLYCWLCVYCWTTVLDDPGVKTSSQAFGCAVNSGPTGSGANLSFSERARRVYSGGIGRRENSA